MSAGLLSHDGCDLCCSQRAACDHPGDLGGFQTVHHQNLVDFFAPALGFDQQRHVKHQTARTAVWASRSVSSATRGWMMRSRRARADGSANTKARMRSRSRAPAAVMVSAPKVAAIAGMAKPCGAVTEREIASASSTVAPQLASIDATVLLPLPMPPVNPSRKACAIFKGRRKKELRRDQPP